jgi:nucleotide-binding universal stress UspA family protein
MAIAATAITAVEAPLVVGVDGSRRSGDAVSLAIALADPDQQILLTHVRPHGRLSSLLSGGEREEAVRDIAASTVAELQRLAPSAPWELRLISNRSSAAGLHSIATDSDASLIVVGSSRDTERERSRSIAESVLTGAPVPVAIAPRGYASTDGVLETIGCGFDGSPESHVALDWSAALARRRGARLRVVAVHRPIAFGAPSTAGPNDYRSANAALRTELLRQAREAADALPESDDVTVEPRTGDPVAELAHASAALDLLVLGSRGRGPIRSVLLGSVSRALLRNAECPLVILPRGARH